MRAQRGEQRGGTGCPPRRKCPTRAAVAAALGCPASSRARERSSASARCRPRSGLSRSAASATSSARSAPATSSHSRRATAEREVRRRAGRAGIVPGAGGQGDDLLGLLGGLAHATVEGERQGEMPAGDDLQEAPAYRDGGGDRRLERLDRLAVGCGPQLAHAQDDSASAWTAGSSSGASGQPAQRLQLGRDVGAPQTAVVQPRGGMEYREPSAGWVGNAASASPRSSSARPSRPMARCPPRRRGRSPGPRPGARGRRGRRARRRCRAHHRARARSSDRGRCPPRGRGRRRRGRGAGPRARGRARPAMTRRGDGAFAARRPAGRPARRAAVRAAAGGS